MEKAPRGMLERMQEGQAMYVTAGGDFKIDAVAQGIMDAAMKEGVDLGTHMGVAFNRSYTLVGKDTPEERELVVVRVWLKDRRARDYWVTLSGDPGSQGYRGEVGGSQDPQALLQGGEHV